MAELIAPGISFCTVVPFKPHTCRGLKTKLKLRDVPAWTVSTAFVVLPTQ